MTHDQEEALSLADRILVIIDGQTRQIGTPEELDTGLPTPTWRSSWATATCSAPLRR